MLLLQSIEFLAWGFCLDGYYVVFDFNGNYEVFDFNVGLGSDSISLLLPHCQLGALFGDPDFRL